MHRKIIFAIIVILVAFSILFVSILRATRVRFEVDGVVSTSNNYHSQDIQYSLAHPGNVLPNHAIWPLKVVRDKVWLIVTTDEVKKADLLLLLADKRLASAQKLLEQQEYESALASVVKAQSYLELSHKQEEKSRIRGVETVDTLRHLAYASLKHYDVMNSMIDSFPDDAKVVVIESQVMPKLVYESARDALLQKGIDPPENPFKW